MIVLVQDKLAQEDLAPSAKFLFEKVYFLPNSQDHSIEDCLWHVPSQEKPEVAVWLGYIPTQEQYQEMYDVLRDKNIYLINTPEQHYRAMRFDAFYPLIRDLTPFSMVISNVKQCESVSENMNFPMFVKGAIKSQKEQGLDACLAHDLEDLKRKAENILQRSYSARNLMVCREFVKLRHTQKTLKGFPIGREFRTFVYRNSVISCNFYWNGEDELDTLTSEERKTVYNLVRLAASRVNVNLLAVDVGQLEDGSWIVIEVGDPQCCGISKTNAFEFWNKLIECMESENEA